MKHREPLSTKIKTANTDWMAIALNESWAMHNNELKCLNWWCCVAAGREYAARPNNQNNLMEWVKTKQNNKRIASVDRSCERACALSLLLSRIHNATCDLSSPLAVSLFSRPALNSIRVRNVCVHSCTASFRIDLEQNQSVKLMSMPQQC